MARNSILFMQSRRTNFFKETSLLEKNGYDLVVSFFETADESSAEEIDLAVISIDETGQQQSFIKAKEFTALDIPVLFLSLTDDLQVMKKAQEYSPYGYVIKDDKGINLLAAVNTAFSRIMTRDYEQTVPSDSVKKPLKKAGIAYNKLFASMLEAFALHEIICDEEGNPVDYRFLEVNPAFERLTGLKKENVIGKTVLEILPETEFVWIKKYGKVALSGESVTFDDFSQALGKYYHITAFSPQKNRFAVLFTDITEHKKNEEKLLLHSLVLDQIEDRVTVTDLDGVITYINDAEVQTMGYSREELIGSSVEKYGDDFKRGATQQQIIKETLAKGKWSGEVVNKDSQGNDVYFFSRTHLVRDKNGNKIALSGISTDITEIKKAENELKNNYALLKIAGETAKFGGWIVDLNTNICTWSDAVADIHEAPHGYAPPVSEGINFYAPEWRKKISQVFAACAEKGIPYDEEMEIITLKGKRVWARTIGRAVKDETGKITRVQGSFQDITERKKAEQALRESEAFTRTVLDNLPIGIAVNSVAPEAVVFSYMNDKFSEIYRTSRQKLEDSFWDSVYEDSQFRKKLRKRVEADCASGDPQRMRWTGIPVTCKGQETRYITAQNIPIPNRSLMISTVIDITDVKQAQEALHRIEWMLSKKSAAETKYPVPSYGDLSELNSSRLILDSVGKNVLQEIANDFLSLLETSAAIYEKNGDYALGIFASGWCRFMDRASRELCNTEDNRAALQCGKWVCHESCWNEASLPAIESGQPVDIECQGGVRLYAVPIVAGEEIIGAINFGYGDPPRDEKKLNELAEKYRIPLDKLLKKAKEYETRPYYIVETAKDRLKTSAKLIGEIVSRKITQKEILKLNRELEQRVIERTAQLKASVKELEAFSYSVSHDLRAPLRHINGYVDLLNKRYQADLPEKAQYYLNTIADSVEQMGTLITELLQLSKTGRQKVRKARLEMNAPVNEVVAALKQDTVGRDIIWKIEELPQVYGDYSLLKQLWFNLLDNAVKFTRNETPARISIGCREEEKNIIFFVRDNGVGFDMKYANKLFGSFQRLHSRSQFEGTGIGLAIVQRIINKHKGQIWAEAESGKGAAFFFSLPNRD